MAQRPSLFLHNPLLVFCSTERIGLLDERKSSGLERNFRNLRTSPRDHKKFFFLVAGSSAEPTVENKLLFWLLLPLEEVWVPFHFLDLIFQLPVSCYTTFRLGTAECEETLLSSLTSVTTCPILILSLLFLIK